LEAQIDEIKKEHPEKKIGVVTFNSDVTLIGDGSQDQQTVTGDKLNNFDFLLNNGIEQGQKCLTKPVKDTSQGLQQSIMNIQETGPTALGPALLTAIGMAS
jgi:hypothetical protein